MGGKNPTIISRTADLDKAADGVARAAFGFGGQKCSANSRVYVEREVHDAFVQRLDETAPARSASATRPIARTGSARSSTPRRSRATRTRSQRRSCDGQVVAGGERLTDGKLGSGYYVAPTIATGLPPTHRLFRDELFVPFVAVAPIDSIEEGIELSNQSEYALTAGFYGEDEAEQRKFLDNIHAGVVYVNRRAGATTGAWPGVQPFGGWKGSGSTGKAGGGLYYVQQFMREQSQTVVD